LLFSEGPSFVIFPKAIRPSLFYCKGRFLGKESFSLEEFYRWRLLVLLLWGSALLVVLVVKGELKLEGAFYPQEIGNLRVSFNLSFFWAWTFTDLSFTVFFRRFSSEHCLMVSFFLPYEG